MTPKLDPSSYLMNNYPSFLESLFDQMPIGLIILDRDFKVAQFNPIWLELIVKYTRTSVEEVKPGASFFDLVRGSKKKVHSAFNRALSGETIKIYEWKLITDEIESFWDGYIAPLKQGDEVVGILLSLVDATEREQAQRALAESEERLRLVLSGTNDGIWDWNLVTNQIYYSPVWKKMLGYREDELADEFETWRNLIHPEDVEKALAAIRNMIDNGVETFNLEHRLLHKDGVYRWIKARGVLVKDEQGRPVRIAGAHTDIHPQKMMETALQSQLALEKVITSLSTRFINLPSDRIDDGIMRALARLGEYGGVDRSYVFLYSPDHLTMSNTYEWNAPGILPQHEHLQEISVGTLPWSNNVLLRGNTLHVARVADLPEEAVAERREFQKQGTQSLVAVPIMYQNHVIGFLGFDSVRRETVWTDQSISLLKIVGEIFANAIERKRAQAIQAGQQQFMELLATGGDFTQTLNKLIDIIEDQLPGILGLVLLMDPDGMHLHVGAYRSLPEEYIHSIEGIKIGPMVGSCGTAAYTRQRVIVEDIADDPKWGGEMRDLGLKYGLHACWSQPVISANGEVLGTFAMYYREPRQPNDNELHTIEVAAHLVEVAVEYRNTRQQLDAYYRTLETRVDERTRELTSLFDVQQAITSRLKRTSVLQKVADSARWLTNSSHAAVFLVNQKHKMVVAVNSGEHPDSISVGKEVVFSGAMFNGFLAKGQIVYTTTGELRKVGGLRPIDQGEGQIMVVPLIAKGNTIGVISLFRDAGDYSSEDERVMRLLASSAVIGLENSRLYEEELIHNKEVERRREAAEGLQDILKVLNSNRPQQEVLDFIVVQSRGIMGANGCIIRRGDLQAGTVATEASTGIPDDLLNIFNLVRSTGRQGNVYAIIARGSPVVQEDYQDVLDSVLSEVKKTDPLAYQMAQLTSNYFRSGLVVPIIIKGTLYGSLRFYFVEKRNFSDEDIRMAMTLGDHVALAIENARLRAQSEQTAVAAERNRLARDLHDAVTQTLFSASLIAEVVPRLWDRNPLEARKRLEELRQLTRGALAEMRTLLLELRPSALVEAEVNELFRHLADAFTGRARLQVTLELDLCESMPDDIKIVLYRIAQEALNNIAKHAEATQVLLSLSCKDGNARMIVRDNGRGFNPARITSDHLGLGIMKERAESVGAMLQLRTEVGSGTEIEVTCQYPAVR